MSKAHPLSKNIEGTFKVLVPLRIWRSFDEEFFLCTKDIFLDKLEAKTGFKLEKYQKIIRANYNGKLPDGYYYADYLNQIGGYLNTDSYVEMILILEAKNLICLQASS